MSIVTELKVLDDDADTAQARVQPRVRTLYFMCVNDHACVLRILVLATPAAAKKKRVSPDVQEAQHQLQSILICICGIQMMHMMLTDIAIVT